MKKISLIIVVILCGITTQVFAQGDLCIGGKLGIGNSAPTGVFQIGTSTFTVLGNGNVGIGTNNPADKLYIAGANPVLVLANTNDDPDTQPYMMNNYMTFYFGFKAPIYNTYYHKFAIASDGCVGLVTNYNESTPAWRHQLSDASGNVSYNESSESLDFRIKGDTDSNLFFVDGSADKIGISTNAPTAKLDVNSNVIRIRTAKTPASASDTGNVGDICWDSSYVYICVATNTWKRSNLSTW